MRVLVDAHAVLWAVDDPPRLSTAATGILQNSTNELWISAGTVWEIAIKVGLAKLKLSSPFLPWMVQAFHDLTLHMLPISLAHTDKLTQLPHHHRDPFDRLIIAQALVEQIPIVSGDPVFDQYGIQRVW
jgi:PIN domain nuclease of toxin-antitoxin system